MLSLSKKQIQAVFGRRVKELRSARQISQEALAEKADLHRTYISDLERGNRNVSIENILKLAHGLGVSPTELLVPFDKRIIQGEGEV